MAAARSSKSSSSSPAPSTTPPSTSISASSSTSSSPSPTPTKTHTKNVFRLHGVNVLNRKNVDSIARLTALERRRATHILDERQRRDTMNQLITELGSLVRESANDVTMTGPSSTSTPHSVPSTPQPPSPSPRQRYSSTEEYGGIEKKSTVKSNSITTLRNAIDEIRRLRSCAGLKPVVSTSMTAAEDDEEVARPDSPSSMSLSPSEPELTQTLPPEATPIDPSVAIAVSALQQLNSPPLSPSSPPEQYSLLRATHQTAQATIVAMQQESSVQQAQLSLPPLSAVVLQIPQQQQIFSEYPTYHSSQAPFASHSSSFHHP
ncbi:hypothetical protein BGZ83_009169 [Gryganskiella cystojenkinii]|nr:hypothetical protein BGZ83_009169 [Gryganskiella cystojenkinii]